MRPKKQIKILDQITECELIIETDDSELKDLATEDLELNKNIII